MPRDLHALVARELRVDLAAHVLHDPLALLRARLHALAVAQAVEEEGPGGESGMTAAMNPPTVAFANLSVFTVTIFGPALPPPAGPRAGGG